MPTSCPSRDRLSALLSGRLSDDDADSLVQHLENCSACQTSVHALRAADTLIDVIREQPRLSCPDDPLLAQLIARVSELVVPAPAADDYARFLDPPDNPGDLGRLGPYRIQRILGSGGMGLVFQAEEVPL